MGGHEKATTVAHPYKIPTYATVCRSHEFLKDQNISVNCANGTVANNFLDVGSCDLVRWPNITRNKHFLTIC